MNERFEISLPFSEPVLIFALVMLIILLAPIIFRKLKIPGIVGLILSGTIAGPSILGLLERDFTIELLGTVGLLYLMFMAGLSIDLNRFEKLRNRSIGFGTLSFLLPAAGAVWIGTSFLDFTLATSFLAGSIVGSHTLLAYPIVERLGITKNTAVTMSMGGTLVTDSLSLGILAIVAGSAGGSQGAGYWLGFSTSIIIFLAAAVLILPRLGRWFFRNMEYQNNTDFVFMVAVLFVTSYLAELAGLASIIGAFIAGLLLNRLVPESSTLMSRIQFVGNALFIPFFLISVGMLVDVQVLASLNVWMMALVFTALVMAGKGLASYLISLGFSYTKEEGYVVYGLTIPQSAATLAVTLLAYDLGFFDQTTVNAVVIMILLTCLAGPWLVEKYGRVVAIQEDEKPFEASDAPQRILVPLANPETSDALMDIAFMVRDEKSDQPVFPLTVARDGKNVDSQVAGGEKMLSHAVIHAAAAEVPVRPMTRVDFNVAKGISRAVSERLISNVIIGWNGEVSARRRIFGTILDQLLQDIDEMVMVCKLEKPVNTFQRVIVAIPPFASLEMGFSGVIRSVKLLAEQSGGELLIVTSDARSAIVRERIEKVKPDLDIIYHKIDLWSDIPKWLENHNEENDLFVLVSAREGSLSWRPGLNRLPRVIAQRYSGLSFITVYPSEVEIKTQAENQSRTGEILYKEKIKVGLDGGSLQDDLREILAVDGLLNKKNKEKLIRRLLKNSVDYAREMMSGAVLLESHTSHISNQMLYIGVDKKGIKIPQTSNQAHVIFILLSPKEMSTDEHLQALNTISKFIKPGENLDKIKQAKSSDEVYNLLVRS
ncbi:MAG: cation:proton antiporter [Balneolaceae bacterium]